MASAMKTVSVGRFDQAMKNIAVPASATVKDILDKAGLTLSSGEEVNSLNGRKLALSGKPANNATLVITGNVKSGFY